MKCNFRPLSRATNIVQLPLAFVRSGYVNLNYGQARIVGDNGYGWSRTANSSTGAYYLYMNPTDVDPSGNYYRYGGFLLRWL